MQFSKVPNNSPKFQSNIYFPIEGQTNYRSATVVTPFVLDEKGEPTAELDITKKFFFFEYFEGADVSQKVPIQHMGAKRLGKKQEIFPIEKVVTVKEYLSASVNDPAAVAKFEAWLDARSL